MSELFDVKDRAIAITGGAGVLCSELARQLAARGAKVAILDYDIAKANELAKEIQSTGGTAVAVETNVLERSAVENALKQTNEAMGAVDVLINGAGGNKKQATTSPDLSFFDMPADAIKAVFELNFIGTLLPCQIFGRQMADAGAGNILNISSMCAFSPLTKVSAYSAAKAAVSNFTQWLAVHMCQNYSKDIRVNAIAPGFFLTEQNRFLLTEKSGDLTPRGQTIIDHTPMGKFGSPNDLTGAVLWLTSDASKFVTGTVIPIDGGFNAFSGV